MKKPAIYNRYPTEYPTLDTAERIYYQRIGTQVPTIPLRLRPAIIYGPNDGYMVVDLGWALREGFTPIR